MRKIIPTMIALLTTAFCYFAQPAIADDMFTESRIKNGYADTITKINIGKHQVSAEYDTKDSVKRYGVNIGLEDMKLKIRTDEKVNATRLCLNTKLSDNLILEIAYGESDLGKMSSFTLHYDLNDLIFGLGQTQDLGEKTMIAYLAGKFGDLGISGSIDHKDVKTFYFGEPGKWRTQIVDDPKGIQFYQFILGDRVTGFGGYRFLGPFYAKTNGEQTIGAQDTDRYTGADIHTRGSKALHIYKYVLPNGTEIFHYEVGCNPNNKGNWIGFAYRTINGVVQLVPEAGLNFNTPVGNVQFNCAVKCDEEWKKSSEEFRIQLKRKF